MRWLFLLQDLKYRLSSAQDPSLAAQLPRQTMLALDSQAEDGVGLVCGFFHFQPGLSALIIEALPEWILLRADDPSSHAARTLFQLILEECQRTPANPGRRNEPGGFAHPRRDPG